MSAAVHPLLDGPRPEAPSIAGDFPLDRSVLSNLPEGIKVLSANRYRKSVWTITAQINAELADGTQARYFLKCAAEDGGRIMMEGEHAAMSELYKTMPNFVPRPIC
jgi:protein-ribulosamine 3-kinase